MLLWGEDVGFPVFPKGFWVFTCIPFSVSLNVEPKDITNTINNNKQTYESDRLSVFSDLRPREMVLKANAMAYDLDILIQCGQDSYLAPLFQKKFI